jgi:hypothetical protein
MRQPSELSDIHPVDEQSVLPTPACGWLSATLVPKFSPKIVMLMAPVVGPFHMEFPLRTKFIATGGL